jgi:arylsulfatase A-like enzyme
MKGIVTVKKVFPDGREELVSRDDNIITVGLAESFVNIFSNNIPANPADLLVGYFQVGSGAHSIPEDPSLRTHIYSLAEPFLELDYGLSSTDTVDIHDQVYPVKGNFSETTNTQVFKGTFIELGDEFSSKVTADSVYYRLNLGLNTANGKSISEFGLFSRNPNSLTVERSSMIAYKSLDSAIVKSELFELCIDWQLRFVDSTIETEGLVTHSGDGTGFNVVLIMADDLGIDTLGIYDGVNPYELSCPSNANASPFSPLSMPADGCGIYPHTPTLSAMATGGMTFFNARANTMCSPTRANVLTGKCAFSSPGFVWTGQNGDELYKGLWGHGIASVFTQQYQNLRGGLKGLGAVYKYKNADPNCPFLPEIPLGTPISLEFGVTGGNKNDSQEDRRKWPSSWLNRPIQGTGGSYHALGYIPGNFTVISDLIRNPEYAPSAYTTAMTGKWHLAHWEGLPAYREGNLKTYGNGWEHIHNIGRWDYANAMFANLDRVPIPGHAGDTTNLTSEKGWEVVQDNYSLSDANMGYINYFQYNYSGVDDAAWQSTSSLTTVSDTGYTTFTETDAGVTYAQGETSSYATNKTFADASALFNTIQEPFFMYIPLNTPHAPYTYPPYNTVYNSWYNENHPQILVDNGTLPNTATAASAIWVTYNAMVENMDWCVSAFLSGIDSVRKDRTIFIFQGDNGQVEGPLTYMNLWASSTMNTASGIGADYMKMLNPGDYADLSAGLGGNNDSDERFKGSCYDRGVIIPYIVSASFMSDLGTANTSSNAFVDVVDNYTTIGHIAGLNYDLIPNKQEFHTDGISILPLLRGEVDASSHVRQFSFFENVRPIGNTTGDIDVSSGTYTGQIAQLLGIAQYPWNAANNYGLSQQADVKGQNVAPWVPYERRRGYIKQSSKSQLGNQFLWEQFPPSRCSNNNYNNQADCLDAGETWTEGTDCAYGDILDISAGQYKFIRNTAGNKYDELYHMKNTGYVDVDPFEYNNLLAPWRGSNILGGIMSAADVTDPTDHHWTLARIYIHLRTNMLDYLQYRTYQMSQVNSIYNSSPLAAERVQMPATNDIARIEPI